jgi:hypothetical protein
MISGVSVHGLSDETTEGNATDLTRWLTAARHRRITYYAERFSDNAVVEMDSTPGRRARVEQHPVEDDGRLPTPHAEA